jgi:hypothetical protein
LAFNDDSFKTEDERSAEREKDKNDIPSWADDLLIKYLKLKKKT